MNLRDPEQWSSTQEASEMLVQRQSGSDAKPGVNGWMLLSVTAICGTFWVLVIVTAMLLWVVA